MKKHYVQFFYPGALVSEIEEREVKSRDPKILKGVPKNCYAFRFFDREETTKNGEKLIGEDKNFSHTYYINGDVYTLSQVKKHFPSANVLISNMEINNWKKVIRNKFGQFMPFDRDDEVII